MRKFLLATAAALGLLTLSGCGDYRENTTRNVVVQEVTINGREVDCVIYDDNRYEQGGISCDFAGDTSTP